MKPMSRKPRKTTEAMRQYYNIKDTHKDTIVFFQLGDFYETFNEDAKITSKTLDIKLTSSEVIDFLKYPKDLLIQLGFNIILPNVFTRGGKQRLTARLIIRYKDAEKPKKGKAGKEIMSFII